jgi:hypothetical protein
MTDVSGPAGANGAPKPSGAQAGPRPGDARVAPELKSLGDDLTRELDNGAATPKDVRASTQGDVSSEKAATMAKAKSTTSRAAGARAAAARPAAKATARTSEGSAEPSRPAPNLSEDESVLLAGIDRAEDEAERLRAWAMIRREEAKDAIRTHPLGSSVIVFAAGMIFGLLMARR